MPIGFSPELLCPARMAGAPRARDEVVLSDILEESLPSWASRFCKECRTRALWLGRTLQQSS